MLPINFHQKFIPERRYLSALLRFAASGCDGTLKEISEATGIPMGGQSGKMPAILDYARGMGLISLGTETRQNIKRPALTDMGQIILDEDPSLSESLTQTLLHMNLCRNDMGACAWNAVFAKSNRSLRSRFLKTQLEGYLRSNFGEGNNRTGPLIATYLESAALSGAGVIEVDGDLVIREKAPLFDLYSNAYVAYTLNLLETYFPGQNQVTLPDFNQATELFDICMWDQQDIEVFCSLIQRKQMIQVDRQMQPWLLHKKRTSQQIWPMIFDDIA